MIQRTIFRQSRSFASSLRAGQTSSFIQPQSRLAAISFAPSSQRSLAARWYSSEPEKKDGEETKESEVTADDPVKKELEVKNREIIDLKVYCCPSNICHLESDHYFAG